MLANHIRNGLKDSVERLVEGQLAQAHLKKQGGKGNGGSGILGALRWKYTLSFIGGTITTNSCLLKQGVNFVVLGFSDWTPLQQFLAGEIPGPVGEQIWPHVVFTDLHKGERSRLNRPSDVKDLPGFKFATLCLERGRPCIAYTSGEAMTAHPFVFQGQDMFFFFDREEFRIDGQIAKTFLNNLWPRLSRCLWLPDCTLSVEGHKNKNEKTFAVTFYDTTGQAVSHIAKVTEKVYSYLYLWSFGSVLARLRGAPESSEKSPRAIVKVANIDSTRQHLFTRDFYSENRKQIYYVPSGDLLKRSVDILNANIRHLDVPIARSLPNFWNNKDAAGDLVDDMRQILPPDGLKWLENATVDLRPRGTAK